MVVQRNMCSDNLEKEMVIASFGEFILTSKRLLYKDFEREINNRFMVGVNTSYEEYFIKAWLIIPILILFVALYSYNAQYIIVKSTRYMIIGGSYLQKKHIIAFCLSVSGLWLVHLFAGTFHTKHYQISVICSAPFKNVPIYAKNNDIEKLVMFEKKLREVIYPSVLLKDFTIL